MKRVVLISCVSTKGDKKAKAKHLYRGTLFSKSLAYAEKLNPDQIFILSALHHLLDLDTEIEPYDVTLSYVPVKKRKPSLKILSKEEQKQWGEEVIKQLKKVADLENDEFILLAGQRYVTPIEDALIHIKQPLKGMKQGKRTSYLTTELK